jgi:hypothetical protein
MNPCACGMDVYAWVHQPAWLYVWQHGSVALDADLDTTVV